LSSDSGTESDSDTNKVKSTQLANGEFTPIDHWQGQWRLVNIWAEWCKPCWQEIPELNQFNALQNSSDIKLLGFNFDELTLGELALLKQKMQIDFPVLVSWPAHWQKPEIKGLPATVIIAPDDTVKQVLWGEQTVESLQEAVKKLSLL
jgi:thiol-disulfide isomerase/thioredoxin